MKGKGGSQRRRRSTSVPQVTDHCAASHHRGKLRRLHLHRFPASLTSAQFFPLPRIPSSTLLCARLYLVLQDSNFSSCRDLSSLLGVQSHSFLSYHWRKEIDETDTLAQPVTHLRGRPRGRSSFPKGGGVSLGPGPGWTRCPGAGGHPWGPQDFLEAEVSKVPFGLAT